MPILYLINAEPFFMAPVVQADEVMIVRYVQPLTPEHRQLLETTMKDDPSLSSPEPRPWSAPECPRHADQGHRHDLSGPSRHRVGLDQALGTAGRPEFA